MRGIYAPLKPKPETNLCLFDTTLLRGEFENKCECPCIKSTGSISKFLTICCLYYGSCEYFGRKVNVMALSCGSQCKETKHH